MAKLKKMYNGIYFKGKIYRNGDLTEKDALFLLKNHPAGVKLFDELPKEEVKLSVNERIEKINACETIDKLSELLKGEKSKTVLKAGKEKQAELENDYGDNPNPDHEEH